MKNVLPSRVKTWIMTLYLKIVLKVQTTTGPKGEKYSVIFLYNQCQTTWASKDKHEPASRNQIIQFQGRLSLIKKYKKAKVFEAKNVVNEQKWL